MSDGMRGGWVASVLAVLVLVSGCEDNENATGTGGAGGDGGSGATGGSGGAGGAGGSGGAGGNGGAGGGEVTCLPESAYSSLFTLGDADLCAVAVYTADTKIQYQQPTWGAHGGPLLVYPGAGAGEVLLARWSPSSGAEGAMTVETTTIDAQIPANAYAGAEALDLGFRPGTVLSYTNQFPDTTGELIVANGTDVSERYPVNGLFSVATLGAAGSGRLVYSGLSVLGDTSVPVNGLYSADDCSGDLTPAGGSCTAPQQVSAWNDSSGPVVTDAQGNVFVVMSSFGGDQIGRGFAAATIQNGAAPTDGQDVLTLPGFGANLAAIAPDGDAPGLLAFQPAAGDTGDVLDVLAYRYTASNDTLSAEASIPLLTLPNPNTNVALLSDPQGRLWAGVNVPGMGGEPDTTTFVVLARKPD